MTNSCPHLLRTQMHKLYLIHSVPLSFSLSLSLSLSLSFSLPLFLLLSVHMTCLSLNLHLNGWGLVFSLLPRQPTYAEYQLVSAASITCRGVMCLCVCVMCVCVCDVLMCGVDVMC